MIKFFYDSLETLQKVKFATKKDYISLGLGVVFAIVVCGIFFVGVDTFFTGAYNTLYSVMRSDTALDETTGDNLSDAAVSGDVISSGDVVLTGLEATATGTSL